VVKLWGGWEGPSGSALPPSASALLSVVRSEKKIYVRYRKSREYVQAKELVLTEEGRRPLRGGVKGYQRRVDWEPRHHLHSIGRMELS